MFGLVILYLLLAVSDIVITSKVIRQHQDLNPFTEWLLTHVSSFWAALISISIPTISIIGIAVHLDLERTLSALVGARIALLFAQFRAHGKSVIIDLKSPSGE